MKKVFIIMISLVLVIALSGCGNDVVTPTTLSNNEGITIAPHVNKLIESGNQLLNETLSSYSSLTYSGLRADVREVSDFMLFPFNTDSGKSFYDRMKDVYWDKDNVVKGFALLNQAASTNSSSASILRKKIATRGVIGDTAEDIVDSFVPGLSDFCDSIFGGGGPSNEDLERQLTQIGKDLNEMRTEMRQGFASINRKSDKILGNLETMKGDINILKQGQAQIANLIMSSGMNDVISEFNGFLTSYETSVSTTDASNIAYTYFISSSRFWADIEKFINCSKQIQEWATNNNQYSSHVYNDPSASTNVGGVSGSVHWSYWGGPTVTGINMNYENPKKKHIISLGNLNYLSKMIMARLSLNSVLYKGETLRQSNSNIAQQFLDNILPEIKQFIDNAVSALRAQYNSYRNYVITGFWEFIPEETKTDIAGGLWYDTCLHKYGAPTIYYNADKVAALAFLEKDYRNVFMEYFGFFIAKIITLEVQLKSYL